MNRLILVSLLVASICAVPIVQLRKLTTEEDTLFEKFKQQHSKVYFDQHDESYRKQIFVDNLKAIRQHNAEAATGAHTFTLAMNKFGDMTLEEFHTKYTGFLGLRHRFARSQNLATHVEARATVDSVDWTTKGAVTPVKNQGQCGSCWSFSTTGSVEGAWFIAKGKLVSLSEQQLMDCSKSEGNNSCEGGLMDYAFEYIIKNGGLGTEASYPYKAVDENSCKSVPSVASIKSYKDVSQTEAALEAAVNVGPVSVAIEADQEAFQFYSSGVLTGDCGTSLDHGVLAVGYGTDNGVNYWKVKNSWGGDWGMSGYVLIQKGKQQDGGQCGILMAASYPVV
jgi:C1A family cysteine protease